MVSNGRIVWSAVGIVLGMVCLTYASFPLYRLFCQVTGYGGTIKRVASSPSTLGKTSMVVRLNADIDPHLKWEFYPEQKQITLRVGEQVRMNFIVVNHDKTTSEGMATFNVTPLKAAKYFNKIQCFCFNQQKLKPGQKEELPVTFFIDPAIEKDKDVSDVTTMTLSYTFYRYQEK